MTTVYHCISTNSRIIMIPDFKTQILKSRQGQHKQASGALPDACYNDLLFSKKASASRFPDTRQSSCHKIIQISVPLPSLTTRCKVSWSFPTAFVGRQLSFSSTPSCAIV